MATMATMFEPSLSTSAVRPPLNSADAPSMADSLPSINFGFDELRDRMAKFTVRFDNFIEQGRKRVLEERNQFRMNVAELHEDQRMKKKDIEILSSKSTSHQQNLAKEAAETNEMQAAIASLSAQRDTHQTTKESLKQQIVETQKQIDTKLAAQRAHAEHLGKQSRYNGPEIEWYRSNLCFEIDGAGSDDRLKFIFTHIDDRDWTREAWFEIDTTKREYNITHCRPKLEKEKTDRVLEKVNEGREMTFMLPAMRELFVEAFKS